ncbi:hypothetical protein [Streptomyces sp. GESEQ-4]|uniref:hypothetical protein n=1 Tax=Streptomyces sp. GESEQ-4 TaxID=2812655 RepID=UPI001B33512E|nr:hypothetical protein [Streptomyces sp. GESEQ-4]
MSGYWRGAEPRLRVERVVGLDQVLSSMPKESAIAVLAQVLYGASEEEIGKRLGVTPIRARSLISKGISRLRHPMWAQAWQEYFDVDSQALLIDDGLRALIRKWRLEEFAPVCSQCGRRYTPEGLKLGARGGRPRRYCSNACRQRAYRMRHR